MYKKRWKTHLNKFNLKIEKEVKNKFSKDLGYFYRGYYHDNFLGIYFFASDDKACQYFKYKAIHLFNHEPQIKSIFDL